MTRANVSDNSASGKKILLATLAAAAVAVLILIIAILPAEYGIDPLGTGSALGLTALREGEEAAKPVDLKALAEAAPELIGNAQLRTAPVLTSWNRDRTDRYKLDSRKIELGPKAKLEFKYQMRRGANMVYTWQSTGVVKYEFHGEPNAGPEGTYESYAIDDKVGIEKASGSFTAPFSGIHGWYWENTTDAPVTITLMSAGFFSNAEFFKSDGQHETLQLPEIEVE